MTDVNICFGCVFDKLRRFKSCISITQGLGILKILSLSTISMMASFDCNYQTQISYVFLEFYFLAYFRNLTQSSTACIIQNNLSILVAQRCFLPYYVSHLPLHSFHALPLQLQCDKTYTGHKASCKPMRSPCRSRTQMGMTADRIGSRLTLPKLHFATLIQTFSSIITLLACIFIELTLNHDFSFFQLQICENISPVVSQALKCTLFLLRKCFNLLIQINIVK